jgi:hypothetical protein
MELPMTAHHPSACNARGARDSSESVPIDSENILALVRRMLVHTGGHEYARRAVICSDSRSLSVVAVHSHRQRDAR